MSVEFNLKTLDHYMHDDDPDIADIAKETKDDFIRYGEIVNSFDTKMVTLKHDREGFARMDRQRRDIHNNCLTDINMMNRVAKADGLEPFMVSSNPEPSRQELGTAILEQCYSDLVDSQKQQNVLKPDVEINNTLLGQRRRVEHDYNYSVPMNKYPLVEKDGHYQFMDMFTGKETDRGQVETYLNGQETKNDMHKAFQDACDLIDQTALDFSGIQEASDILNK